MGRRRCPVPDAVAEPPYPGAEPLDLLARLGQLLLVGGRSVGRRASGAR
jgi:hypothetical protein